ncbi:hypothetical protein Tco_0980610 [Tanacetum coccineum]
MFCLSPSGGFRLARSEVSSSEGFSLARSEVVLVHSRLVCLSSSGGIRLELVCLSSSRGFRLARSEVSSSGGFSLARLEVSSSGGFSLARSEVFFDFRLIFLMAKKDMYTYVSRLKDTKLETLVATYDIPLDLRPRLPDPNFRMINLPAEDTTIDRVPTGFNQGHVDQLKAHTVKLHDIPEGVLVLSGLSRVWRNLMCDPVLRRSDNTVMSIHDFLCMPSLDKVTIREEPHGLDTSILGRGVEHTTSPTPAGTAIPRASLEEIVVTRPDHKVVTKADHVAKRKASTRPEISTNAAKKTRSSKKGSGAGSSGQSAIDGVEQVDDGTLGDDDDQHDDTEFAMEGIESLNDVSQDKEVEPRTELSGGVRRATRASFHASHGISEDASPHVQEAAPAPDAQPLDVDAGVDEIASDEGSGSESPPYTKDNWEEIHGVNLGLQRKELYKDPKVCRTALDRFPTPAETHRLRELSLVELSDRMSVLQCQLITHGSMLNARYDHSLRNIEHLSKQCAQQTQTIKKQNADLKQQKESTIRANEEVSRKYRNERDVLVIEKSKIEEELVETKSQLEHRGRYLAFGRHLEEIHVTWAHLEKKRTRLRTYTNISQEFLLRD